MQRTTRWVLFALCAAMLLPGCVRRKLVITSETTGALVFLNDEEVGRTPLEVPFTWYGTYDVRLEKPGYAPLWTTAQADAPWWDRPGPDLLAEAGPDRLVEIPWHFEMSPATPAGEVDPDTLLDYARQMRELNQRD
ncbi:MAG: PEGA domain-containing protein [Planctomycetota bacterium]